VPPSHGGLNINMQPILGRDLKLFEPITICPAVTLRDRKER
jgi:hypothetical protein